MVISIRTLPLNAVPALCGMAAPVLFAVTVIVAGYLTPGYNPVTQVMSELGIPGVPGAAVMNIIAFGLVGILLVVFAFAVLRAFSSRRTGAFGSAMVAAAGLFFVAMAVFHCDPGCMPRTAAGNLHLLFGLGAIVAAVLAILALSYAMFREQGWGGYWQYSLVTGILVLVTLPAFMAAQDAAGLLQRLMVGLIFLWTEVLAVRLVFRSQT